MDNHDFIIYALNCLFQYTARVLLCRCDNLWIEITLCFFFNPN